MNYLDIVILIILALFGLKGLRKGLIIEVVTLLALVVGIFGAMRFSDFTAEHLQEVMNIDPKFLNTIAFVLTFVILVVVVNLIGRAASKLAKTLELGLLDGLGGFVFGVAKGVLLCSLIIVVFNNLHFSGIIKEETKKESKLYPYIEQTVPYLYQGYGVVKDFVKEKLPEKDNKTTPDTEPEEEKDSGKLKTLTV